MRAGAPARSTAGRRAREPAARARPGPDDRSRRRRVPPLPVSPVTTTVIRDQSQLADRGVEVLAEFGARRACCRRKSSNNQRGTERESSEPGAHEVPKPACDAVADHRVSDRLAHDKTDPRRHGVPLRTRVGFGSRLHPLRHGMHHEAGTSSTATFPGHPLEVRAAGQPSGRREHGGLESGRQLFAALPTTGRDDRAARAGPHTQTEAVGLGPTTVVRLEGALAHGSFSRYLLARWFRLSSCLAPPAGHGWTNSRDNQ